MKLMFYALDNCNEADLDGDCVQVLEIENSNYFSRIVRSFKGREIEPKEIGLLDRNKNVSFESECDVLFDYSDIDTTSKCIIGKLYNQIADEYKTNLDINDDLANIGSRIESYIENLIGYTNLDLQFSPENIDVKNFMHFVKLVPKTSNDPLERLLDYIALVGELQLFKLLVLVNPKSMFDNKEMNEIYKFALYCGVKLCIIENVHQEKLLEYEKKIYVDSDFFDIGF